MKTLAMSKIEERKAFILRRIHHRYVRAFWGMELLTN